MSLLKESRDCADAYVAKAKTLPAYIAAYNADWHLYNGYEVRNKRKQGHESGCRYLIRVLVARDSLPKAFMILEKCFADREDARNCILWLSSELPTNNWAYISHINDDNSLTFISDVEIRRVAEARV